jgi:anaerobic magnesium-protoporphyrin IX monomethyl ester cyclase
LDERVFMPLGVLKVAASLERAGVSVEVLDLSGYSNFERIVAGHAAASRADTTFAVTATTPQFPAAAAIAKTILGIRPDARLVLGGPHATLTHAAARREKRAGRVGRAHRAFARLGSLFDTIVAGDGEMAILRAIGRDAPALIDADDRHSPDWLTDAGFDASPWPARHLIDVRSYRYTIDGVPALSLIAQLGCPFGCGFCAGRHSPSLRHIRTRSDDNVVAEMRHMADKYGVRGFMFYDDELNVNRGLVELMEKIADAGHGDWRLRGFIKAELFTDQQASAMVRAGFRWVLCGFESGAPRILENINKRATQGDNSRAMEIARRHGLKVKALMSIGHPGESRETIAETRAWLMAERPDDFDVTIITPYPGSPYYDDAIGNEDGSFTYTSRSGDRLHQREVDYAATADYYKGDPNDGYVSHVWTDHLDAAELVHLRSALESDVRAALHIPFNPAAAAVSYEHSMGQSALPSRLLRRSNADQAQAAEAFA